MALPVSLICSRCGGERLHTWRDGQWHSLCCSAPWRAPESKKFRVFELSSAHSRSRGGLASKIASRRAISTSGAS